MKKGGVILVVEDDLEIREIVAEVLRLDGFIVRTAGNGLEALEVLMKLPESPCMIILDLMMPVMSGWEFMAKLEKEKLAAHVPIVVISAGANGSRLPGPINFISKPFDIHEILHEAEKHCSECGSKVAK